MFAFGIALPIVAVVAVAAILYFNRLVRAKTMVREAWSGIDVQLKRRHDLIPNLVETVKGYAAHERGLLEQIARLRTQSQQTASVQEKGQAEQQLTASIRTLFAVAENYPDLKANQNFLRLQQDLTAIEEELQLARRYYNGTVRDYNILVQSFPGVLIAPVLGFRPEEFFAVDDAAERATPSVKL